MVYIAAQTAVLYCRSSADSVYCMSTDDLTTDRHVMYAVRQWQQKEYTTANDVPNADGRRSKFHGLAVVVGPMTGHPRMDTCRLQNVIHGLTVVVGPMTGHPRMDTCCLQLAQTTGTLSCKQI